MVAAAAAVSAGDTEVVGGGGECWCECVVVLVGLVRSKLPKRVFSSSCFSISG